MISIFTSSLFLHRAKKRFVSYLSGSLSHFIFCCLANLKFSGLVNRRDQSSLISYPLMTHCHMHDLEF